jgi:hypothetical protein
MVPLWKYSFDTFTTSWSKMDLTFSGIFDATWKTSLKFSWMTESKTEVNT